MRRVLDTVLLLGILIGIGWLFYHATRKPTVYHLPPSKNRVETYLYEFPTIKLPWQKEIPELKHSPIPQKRVKRIIIVQPPVQSDQKIVLYQDKKGLIYAPPKTIKQVKVIELNRPYQFGLRITPMVYYTDKSIKPGIGLFFFRYKRFWFGAGVNYDFQTGQFDIPLTVSYHLSPVLLGVGYSPWKRSWALCLGLAVKAF